MDMHGTDYIVWLLLAAINLFAFLLFGADKRRAEQGAWRISERTLLGIALFGGSVGALCGMRFFHHKTRKARFSFGIPFILIGQAVLLVWRYF